jgi:hypothetical protein
MPTPFSHDLCQLPGIPFDIQLVCQIIPYKKKKVVYPLTIYKKTAESGINFSIARRIPFMFSVTYCLHPLGILPASLFQPRLAWFLHS